jgi:hypothetical protein
MLQSRRLKVHSDHLRTSCAIAYRSRARRARTSLAL